VKVEAVTYTSGDGATRIPSYLADPGGHGPIPAVLILRGVAGPDDGYIEIAQRLGEWGYVALLHGWKVRGSDPPDEQDYPIDRLLCPRIGHLGGNCRSGVCLLHLVA
jgi:carboxymethylenebutenolidase